MTGLLITWVIGYFCASAHGMGVCDDIEQQPQCTSQQHVPRIFYDSTSGRCKEYVWSGCDTKANNFERLEDCQMTCENRCQLPKTVGDCDGDNPRWYFSVEEGQCEIFPYGGCGGNGNNFESEEDCDRHCNALNRRISNVCEAPKKEGPCEAIFPRYFYDKSKKRCEAFSWGGCEPNSNNFIAMKDCQDTCENVCELPMVTGPCKAYLKRWYYSSSGECEEFTYGGCLGNGNNFESKQACERRCKPISGPLPSTASTKAASAGMIVLLCLLLL